MIDHEAHVRAAVQRAAAMGARADRPRDRCQPGGPTAAQMRGARDGFVGYPVASRGAEMQLRKAESGSGLDFLGYATVSERGYEMWDFFGPYTEIVTAGAGERTLATPNLDVPLVLGHDSMRRIARTTNDTLFLTEDDTGLRSAAPSLDPTDADVAYIAPKVHAGLIDEMSFRFLIVSGQWSQDYTEFRINEYDIHRGDVSIVGYGANPFTSAELRSKQPQRIDAAVRIPAGFDVAPRF